jgi:hypothetical protein
MSHFSTVQENRPEPLLFWSLIVFAHQQVQTPLPR